jgi:hypothetical protein
MTARYIITIVVKMDSSLAQNIIFDERLGKIKGKKVPTSTALSSFGCEICLVPFWLICIICGVLVKLIILSEHL